MKEELLERLKTIRSFIEDSNNYFALFGKVIDSCAVGQELNRICWDHEFITDEEFRNYSEVIEHCRDEAIKTHVDCTIRYLENSKTEHTRKTLVMTIYNDIYQKNMKE